MTGVTRFSARWILPVSAPPIENGAVLVEDGRIARVGPAADVPAPDAASIVELGNAALLPGLVNVHAHPELSILRGALEDLPFHDWISRLRRIKASFSTEDWRDAARWTCAEAAAAGITTLAATEDSDATVIALRDAYMRGVAFREVFGPAPEAADESLRGLRASVAEMRALETDLVRVGVSPHAPYSVSAELFGRVARFAREADLPVAVHIAESDAEQKLVSEGSGPFASALRARGITIPASGESPIALLERSGILRLAPLLIHCVRVDAQDIRRIGNAGARVAHCPVANARLGHGIAPVPELLEAGVAVGLGTDSVASNNRLDLLEEARIAQLMQRTRLLSATLLPAERLLEMVTIDGARALGLDDRIGTLEVGKDADLCAIALTGTHARPLFDPVAALIMSARASDTVLTVVRGRTVYRNGVHCTQDVRALGRRIDALGERVRAAAVSLPSQV
ncbi:MAG TPA: amidohydrolase family protein [Longimicrobiales bacterium]